MFLNAILAVTFLMACSRNSNELKLVQQQQAGRLQNHDLERFRFFEARDNKFTLEFRKIADNELVDVGTVNVAPVMEMAGMGPMMAEDSGRSFRYAWPIEGTAT